MMRLGNELLRRFTVSTSRHGAGTKEGSFKTPLGNFRIREKHGEGEACRTIFRSRKAVGKWTPGENLEADLVLTRILWLEGLDEDNANTYDRFIYFHGTNHEDLLGTPASQGCVRLGNADMLELYDLVPEGTPVTITED
jgi:lipoprotein-anchoring transpeptidase ErfK/SrfK